MKVKAVVLYFALNSENKIISASLNALFLKNTPTLMRNRIRYLIIWEN